MQILLPVLIILGILGILIYFIGALAINYWPWILAWILISFLVSAIKNKNGKNKTYSNRSSNRNRTTFYGNVNQEEAERIFREFFGGAGGFNQNTYGNYGYGSQNNSQGNYYGEMYQEDKSKYYQILGVQKGASADELKKAYFKLVKEHHPDRYTNSSESEKKYHEDKMKQINEAYDKLTKN